MDIDSGAGAICIWRKKERGKRASKVVALKPHSGQGDMRESMNCCKFIQY